MYLSLYCQLSVAVCFVFLVFPACPDVKGSGCYAENKTDKSCPLRAAGLVVIPDTMPTMKRIAQGVGVEMGEATL